MSVDTVQRLTDLLLRLGELNAKHGYSWHADYIRETADVFRISEAAGWDRLASVQFWGGAGSIADTQFSPGDVAWHRANGRIVPEYLLSLRDEDVPADNRLHMKLLADIAGELAGCPATPDRQRWLERGKCLGETFRKWLANPGVVGS